MIKYRSSTFAPGVDEEISQLCTESGHWASCVLPGRDFIFNMREGGSQKIPPPAVTQLASISWIPNTRRLHIGSSGQKTRETWRGCFWRSLKRAHVGVLRSSSRSLDASFQTSRGSFIQPTFGGFMVSSLTLSYISNPASNYLLAIRRWRNRFLLCASVRADWSNVCPRRVF